MLGPVAAGTVALAVGVAIGLVFVAAGALRVVRAATALKERFEGYGELPLLREAELAEARVAIAERALARAPALQLRAERALRELDDARVRIGATLFTVSTGVSLLVSLVFGDF